MLMLMLYFVVSEPTTTPCETTTEPTTTTTPGTVIAYSYQDFVRYLKLKLKLKVVYLHHRYITIKIIGINYYMLQKRDPRSNCF